MGPRRFGTGVTSLPLWMRVAVTAPVVVLELLFLRALVLIATSGDPRPAAFVLFAMGVVAAVAGPVVREMWRSTSEWNVEQARQAANRRLADEVARERPGLPHFVGEADGAAG